MIPGRHAALLLAAGGSTRLGRPKQLVRVRGETLVRRAARMALETEPAQAVVVVGAHADSVFAEVADLKLHRVTCPDWSRGLSTSLRAGVAALREDVAGTLILLCDQPTLTGEHLRELVDAWRSAPDRPAASEYAGVLGVPAVIPRRLFGALGKLEGDQGARELLRAGSEVTALPAASLAIDVDRQEDVDEDGVSISPR